MREGEFLHEGAKITVILWPEEEMAVVRDQAIKADTNRTGFICLFLMQLNASKSCASRTVSSGQRHDSERGKPLRRAIRAAPGPLKLPKTPKVDNNKKQELFRLISSAMFNFPRRHASFFAEPATCKGRRLLAMEVNLVVSESSWYRATLTGIVSLGLAVFAWVFLVGLLDPIFRPRFEGWVWAGSLWLCGLSSAGVAGYSKYAHRPVMSCTIAFALFSWVYMICEGPIFGIVDQGGNPDTTRRVAWNLIWLPVGIFCAAEIGVELRKRAS